MGEGKSSLLTEGSATLGVLLGKLSPMVSPANDDEGGKFPLLVDRNGKGIVPPLQFLALSFAAYFLIKLSLSLSLSLSLLVLKQR